MMRSKFYIVASIATLGLLGLAVWAYGKIRNVDPTDEHVSEEWLHTAEYNREGFKD